MYDVQALKDVTDAASMNSHGGKVRPEILQLESVRLLVADETPVDAVSPVNPDGDENAGD